MKEQIHDYIQGHKKEIVDTLKELIKIPSVRGEAEENSPFGKECARVLEFTQKLYKDYGFDTELDNEGGYLLSYYGKGKKSLGLFAHADVVPVGDDWILTSPFEPLEKDGYIIGRGAIDDKSAVVASLFCARMIKELKLLLKSRLVCFTGANEESGMQCIKNYVQKHTAPNFSLVCDTAFPLYRGNKGILHFVATQKSPMHDVTDFWGGTTFNIILGDAKAKIGEQVFGEKGISRHGALPEGSLNAAHVLSKKLSQSDVLSAYDRKQMDFIANLLEKYYGEVFEIEHTDNDFGKLTVTNGIVKMNDGKISICFDMRYGASLDIKEAKAKISRVFDNNGWSVAFVLESDPFILSVDNPYIVACMNTYKDFTEKRDAKSFVNAGGTYARYLPCAVEIGTSFGGGKRPFELPTGHGHVHQPDECISIDGLLNAIELTMLMLLECDKEHEERCQYDKSNNF